MGRVIEMNELTKRYGPATAVNGLNAPTSGTATVGGRPFRDRPRGLRHAGALLDTDDVHGGRSGLAAGRGVVAAAAVGRRDL